MPWRWIVLGLALLIKAMMSKDQRPARGSRRRR